MSRRRFSRLTKDEVRMVARSKGWDGSKPDGREAVLQWLADRGVTGVEVAELAAQLRAAVAGRARETAAASPSFTLDDVERIVKDTLREHVANVRVDKNELAELVNAAVRTAKPERIVIDGATEVKLKKRTHPMFEKTLRLVKAGVNVLLVGPAGSGKTTLAHHIAEAIGRKFGTLHCTAGMSESQATGWLLPVGAHGTFAYVPAEFVELFEAGNSVFLFDEIDAADPNMLLVLNSALANGALHVPQRYKSPHVPRGKNVAMIAAANTYGTGADTTYAGRNQLDGATLDRFYVVQIDYDTAFEADIAGVSVPDPTGWKPAAAPTEKEIAALHEWVTTLRRRTLEQRLRRVVSTRTLQKAVAARNAGIPTHELKRDLLAGWTRDELAKVGEVV